MCPDNDINQSQLNALVDVSPLLGRQRSGQEPHADSQRFHELHCTLIMLGCQDFGRRHHRALPSAAGHRKQSQHGHRCLTGSHIPLHQAVHGLIGGKIRQNLLPGPFLRACQSKSEILAQPRFIRRRGDSKSLFIQHTLVSKLRQREAKHK